MALIKINEEEQEPSVIKTKILCYFEQFDDTVKFNIMNNKSNAHSIILSQLNLIGLNYTILDIKELRHILNICIKNLVDSRTSNLEELPQLRPYPYLVIQPPQSWKSKKRKSYGICCIRINKEFKLEFLLVKRTCTYSFTDLIYGIYKPNDETTIIKLIQGMTTSEKVLLLNNIQNFDILWNKVQAYTLYENDIIKYNKCKNKFIKTFVEQGLYYIPLGVIIKGCKTSCGELLWEIPKGHKNTFESDEETAIRELKEETNLIEGEDFRVLTMKNPIINNFSDRGVEYSITAYLAYCNKDITPYIDFTNPKQLREIEDIRWLSVNDIIVLSKRYPNKSLITIVKSASKLFKSIYKNFGHNNLKKVKELETISMSSERSSLIN